MIDFKIRAAVEADIPDLVKLVNGAYRGADALKGWTTEAAVVTGQRTDPEMLRDDLKKGTILVAEDPEKLLGCVYLEAGADFHYMGMLTVDPREQSRGIGRELLKASEKAAREHGSTCMELWVMHIRDTLIAWYERQGYRPTGQRMPYHVNETRYGIALLPDLEFVRFRKALS